jgi:hypothetical protein
MEPTEIKEFMEEMEKGGEDAMKHVSLAISILAVLVAMVTVVGHRTHTEAILLQERAADQWNQYQAKKIRQQQTALTADLLALQPTAKDEDTQKKLGEYRAHLTKWDSDLETEQDKAKELEADVQLAERKASRYDLGEALLQIAVVLSSITLLTRSKSYYIFGVSLGIAGILWSASALLIH